MRRHLHTEIYRLVALLQLAFFSLSASAAQTDPMIEIDAATMVLSENGFNTEGPTTIRLESLRATGTALRYDRTAGLFELDGPLTLRSGAYTVRAQSLQWTRADQSIVLEQPSAVLLFVQRIYFSADKAACVRSSCRLENASLATCPTGAPCSLQIRSIRVKPDQSVVIHSATLRLGRVPIFYLPWLKLMPSHKPGLLPPKVAYFPETGLVLGSGGYLPVTDRTSLELSAAGRFAGGVESSAALRGPAGQLQLEYGYLHPDREQTVRARLEARTSLSHGSAAADLDLLNHFDAISQSTFWPKEKILSHTASRARANIVGEDLTFETVVLALQPFEDDGSVAGRSTYVRTGLRANAIALPLGGGFFADVHLGVHRLGMMARDPVLDALNEPTASHNRFDARPSVTWSHAVGPLAARASLGSEHRVWLTSLTADSYSYHAAVGTAEIALPLVKQVGSGFHWIEPVVSYRNNLFSRLSPPPFLFGYLDQPRIGQGIELEVRSHFQTPRYSRIWYLSVAQRFNLGDGANETARLAYMHWSTAIGPPPLRITWRGAFDEHQRTWSWHRIGVSGTTRLIDLQLGYEYTGSGLGPHRDRPELYAAPWPTAEMSVAGAYGSARLKLPMGLQLHSGAHLTLPPAESTKLNTLFYGAVYRTPCPFIRIGLYVSHFGSSLDPSALLTLTAN